MARHVEDFELAEGSDEEEQEEFTNQQYFDSYGTDIAVTKAMLNDAPRMKFYRDAIAAADVKGKVVVDVGAGTGILSLLAARAGAKRVIAIEASAMAMTMQHVVRANGADIERAVRVVHSPAEAVTRASLVAAGHLAEDERVDFVVSEWMGFYLLHENMLPSVTGLRDRLALPGQPQPPRMIPEAATIYAAPVDMKPLLESTCRSVWRDVEGFDLSPVGALEEAAILDCNPCVQVLPEECLLGAATTVAAYDLNTVTETDLAVVSHTWTMQWGASAEAAAAVQRRPRAALWGFALWFDVSFNGITLHTGPAHAATHWKQTVVLLPDELRGEVGVAPLVQEAQAMEASLEMMLNRATRSYEVGLGLADPNE